MGKYDEIPRDVKEYYNKKLQETGIRMVPGHYPVLKTKEEIDKWFSMWEKMFDSKEDEDEDNE